MWSVRTWIDVEHGAEVEPGIVVAVQAVEQQRAQLKVHFAARRVHANRRPQLRLSLAMLCAVMMSLDYIASPGPGRGAALRNGSGSGRR